MSLIKKKKVNIDKNILYIPNSNIEPIFKIIDERLNYDENIMSFVTRQTEILWTVDEIPYNPHDIQLFNLLLPEHQTLIKSIILYFLFAEKIVICNLDEIKHKVPYESAKNFYILQEYDESIHDRTYFKSGKLYYNNEKQFILDSELMEQIITTAKLYPDEIFDIDNYYSEYYESKSDIEKKIFKAVSLKLNLMNKWKNVKSFLHNLVAFFTIESVSFNCLFVLINLFKTHNKGVKYLVEINEFVARDESIHSIFGIYLYKNYILNHLPENEIITIIKDITETEIEFLKIIMPENFQLNNFTQQHFIDYLYHTANIILQLLNISPIYIINNPIPNEFNLQSLKIKSNFFERSVLYIQNFNSVNANDVLKMYNN